MRGPASAWKVLLIGGHSGAGKTVVARDLAHQYGVGLAEVDDFRLALQRMTAPAQQPTLHALLYGAMASPSPGTHGPPPGSAGSLA